MIQATFHHPVAKAGGFACQIEIAFLGIAVHANMDMGNLEEDWPDCVMTSVNVVSPQSGENFPFFTWWSKPRGIAPMVVRWS